MKELFDKENCLVNVASSILRHYHVDSFHPSLKLLDKALNKTDKKICIVLFDGFGKAIREVYKNECPNIRAHTYTTITSVFPPTTVAATTALTTGRFPMETGWLGWTEQFPMYEKAVTMFPSTFADENVEKTPISSYECLPVTTIFEILNQHGVKADKIQDFSLEDKSIPGFFKATDKKLKEDIDFLYAYCVEPDSLLHDLGVGNETIRPVIKAIDEGMKKLAIDNPDTLFIVLADHGHKNATHFSIDEHGDFYSLLRIKHFSIESRAANFYVENGKQDEFRRLAEKYYGEHFYILSKKEVLDEHVFGYGKASEKFESLLGDFLLISKDEATFVKSKDDPGLVSHHAGSSDEEKYIDVSLFNL